MRKYHEAVNSEQNSSQPTKRVERKKAHGMKSLSQLGEIVHDLRLLEPDKLCKMSEQIFMTYACV